LKSAVSILSNEKCGDSVMLTIHMIYPEVQCVTEEDIATMYSDGVANGECNPGFEDNLEGMMEELQSSGKFTFEAFDH
jgi:hypothetical protein